MEQGDKGTGRRLLVAAMMTVCLVSASPAQATDTFTVDRTGDTPDANVGDGDCDVSSPLTSPSSASGMGDPTAPAPKRIHGLSEGRHIFRVRAVDADGNVDPTPAV